VESCAFNPLNPDQLFATTEWQGLWVSNNINDAEPVFEEIENYNFMHPFRVFFNPFNLSEIWIASFGNGLKTGTANVGSQEHTIELIAGWNSLSSYLIPAQTALEDVFAPIADKLIIAQTMTGIYYPDQNINTIGCWESHSAFKVKTNAACLLTIEGEQETNPAVQLNAGWNLLPVVTPNGAEPADLFSPVNGFVIAKEIAGTGVYWPQYNINSIGYIVPGRAYYVLMTASGVVDFTGMKKSQNLPGFDHENLKGFQDLTGFGIASTSSSHTIAILPDALKGFEPGTIIGAYDQAGNCFGAAVINSKFISITVFGDDPTTAEKDGFFEGELIFFKSLTDLNPIFNPTLPQSNSLFTENGLSAITGFETVTGIGNEGLESAISIDPKNLCCPNCKSYLCKMQSINKFNLSFRRNSAF
jgi:hypothetical protein